MNAAKAPFKDAMLIPSLPMNGNGISFFRFLVAVGPKARGTVGDSRLRAAWRANEDPADYRAEAEKDK